MECKKYNKLVNIQKRSRLTDIENKLVVTSRERGRGKIGVGGGEVGGTNYWGKIGSWMYCTTRGI